MPYRLPASLSEAGSNTVRIEEGRVVNVDMAHYTVDVRTLHTQRQLIDLQWANPYFHFYKGEGITFMPEVGAICKVCLPSDSPPFILCFTTTFEREPPIDAASVTEDGEEQTLEVSYRSGRPRMQQGDLLLSTRDGNQIWLHRGGVVEIGSTGLCKRIYIPLMNTIRDLCENYNMYSIAGEASWLVKRSDLSADGEAEASYTMAVRNHGQDELATVFFRMGHVDDTKRLRLVVAPKTINMDTGSVDGDVSFKLDIDEEGSVECEVKNDVSVTVKGNKTEAIEGSLDVTVQGDISETCQGNKTVRVTGDHTTSAQSSVERIVAGKTISAQFINLGQAAVFPVVVATPALVAYITAHTHPIAGPATGPPVQQLPANIYTSTKAKAE